MFRKNFYNLFVVSYRFFSLYILVKSGLFLSYWNKIYRNISNRKDLLAKIFLNYFLGICWGMRSSKEESKDLIALSLHYLCFQVVFRFMTVLYIMSIMCTVSHMILSIVVWRQKRVSRENKVRTKHIKFRSEVCEQNM